MLNQHTAPAPGRGFRAASICCIAFGLAAAGRAATNSPATTPETAPGESSIAILSNSPVRMLAPNIFQIGKVTIDKSKRAATFPASLDKDAGLMEYLLVTTYGKTHESIFKTEAEPFHIHLAMLLLGAKGAQPDFSRGNPPPPGPIINPSKEALPGDKVAVEVAWTENGREVRRRAADFVSNEQTHAAAEAARWIYNGSEIADGRFFAQIDGSIISLVTDPVALVNYTGRGHDNDQIWVPNTNNLPPREAQLQIILTLETNTPTP